MSSPFIPPPDQPDYPGEQYQPPQPPNFQPKKILSTPWRVTLAIAGAVAVLIVIGLVVSSASSRDNQAACSAYWVIWSDASTGHNATAAADMDTLQSTQSGITSPTLSQAVSAFVSDMNTDDASDAASESTVVGSACMTLGFANPDAAAAPAASTPAAADPAAAPAPAGTQAPVDTPATQASATQTPATQAAPAPATSATTVASVRPVFDCYVNQNEPGGEQDYGAAINIHSGTGTGYSTATVKVTVFDGHGNVLGTQTVTANSSTEEWDADVWAEGGPASLATESSCTATVESAS